MNDIKFVISKDWQVVYVNNQKYTEGYEIKDCDWFALGRFNQDLNWDKVDIINMNDERMKYDHFIDFPDDFRKINKRLYNENNW